MGKPLVVWSPRYEVDIGPHVFPTAKYRLVRDRLLEAGWAPEDFVEPEPATPEMLARVHTAEYLRKILDDDFTSLERMRLEVPFSPELRVAAELSCGGTLLAARHALEHGVGLHLGGGFHHAFDDHGEGFCLLNDVAVAATQLLAEGAVKRVAVVDLDVHQGNGTAEIFEGDERVFTFSMHQEENYPFVKPPSDLDIDLPDGTGDDRYLAILDANLPRILERRRPQLVFYLAGADPYREDELGGLALSMGGLRRRDAYVLATARGAGACVAVVLAGGYAFRRSDTVEIHAATLEEARRSIL
jgi:acetoin utilization deacetylase AcuC-like enzyme